MASLASLSWTVRWAKASFTSSGPRFNIRLEPAIFGAKMLVSLWNLAGASGAELPRRPCQFSERLKKHSKHRSCAFETYDKTFATETERSSEWQSRYSPETLKTSFNVSSEYQGCHPDELSVCVATLNPSRRQAVHYSATWAPWRPELPTARLFVQQLGLADISKFRITGLFQGESIGDRRIPLIKGSLYYVMEKASPYDVTLEICLPWVICRKYTISRGNFVTYSIFRKKWQGLK